MNTSRHATLSSFLESIGEDTVDFAKFVEYDKSLNSLMTVSTIFDLYSEQISARKIQIKLNETELNKYMYNCKMLCADLYGNVFMSKLILILNSMRHEGDFDSDLIYIYNPSASTMQDLMTMLYKYTYEFKRS